MAKSGPISSAYKDCVVDYAPTSGKVKGNNFDEYAGSGGATGDKTPSGNFGIGNLTSYTVQGTDSSTKPPKGVGEYSDTYKAQ